MSKPIVYIAMPLLGSLSSRLVVERVAITYIGSLNYIPIAVQSAFETLTHDLKSEYCVTLARKSDIIVRLPGPCSFTDEIVEIAKEHEIPCVYCHMLGPITQDFLANAPWFVKYRNRQPTMYLTLLMALAVATQAQGLQLP